ncbi:hypothetical protein U1Q18_022294 [Sarracenia purpurea var. burkii]
MSDALINGLAGAGGGIIAQFITYPLQTVNTRQQTERGIKKERKKRGTVEEMYQVVKQEGWNRLYGGLAPSLIGTAASQGVYYYFYQIFRNKVEVTALENKKKGFGDGSVGMFSSLVVAALSGCVNVLLTNPIWVVVTRMQTHTKKSQSSPTQSIDSDEAVLATVEPPPYGTSHAIQELYDEGGVFGFWKGVLPTLIMVSNPSIQFMLYETLLKKLKQRRALGKKDNNGVTAMEIFLFGALAKLGATVITYPLLVVKSRLQAKQVTGGDKRHHYKGTLDAIMKMIQYEGFYGFYKGMSTKIVQSVLAAAVLFMVKEELVRGVRRFRLEGNGYTVKLWPCIKWGKCKNHQREADHEWTLVSKGKRSQSDMPSSSNAALIEEIQTMEDDRGNSPMRCDNQFACLPEIREDTDNPTTLAESEEPVLQTVSVSLVQLEVSGIQVEEVPVQPEGGFGLASLPLVWDALQKRDLRFSACPWFHNLLWLYILVLWGRCDVAFLLVAGFADRIDFKPFVRVVVVVLQLALLFLAGHAEIF